MVETVVSEASLHVKQPQTRLTYRRCGSAEAHGFYEKALLDSAALAALVTITLQIAYLPTLYAAFNRRETEIELLNSRAGSPSWGPELLARTHYALGSGTSSLDTLPELYAQWERWAADVTESHVTYSPLIWFRSARMPFACSIGIRRSSARCSCSARPR